MESGGGGGGGGGDVFALLTGGAGVRFDRRRFGGDIETFKPKAPAARAKAHEGCFGVGDGSAIGGPASSDEDEEHNHGSGGSGGGDVGGASSPAAAAVFGVAVDPGCPIVHSRDPNEADNAMRKHYRIKVVGHAPPPPLRSFAELASRLGAPAGLMRNLAVAGYAQPTPIQRQAIPALRQGCELLAVAPTGSGKTLAFLVPIMLALRDMRTAGDWPAAPKAVVLSHTNELAMQQARVLKMLLPGSGLRGCLLSKSTAAGSEFSKVDILLANPLRLLALVNEGKIDLRQVRHLVLDEADKLFELGFMEQIDGIIAACTHDDVVRSLFSATLPEKVEEVARSVLQRPLRVTVGVRNSAAASVRQRLVFAGKESGKLLALRQIVREGLTPPVLVFVATKDRARALHRELLYDGIRVDSIHSEQSHAARAAAVDNFRAGRTWLLIATDLVGRGMDFVGVRTVVNYDFPNSTADYIHRVGRTGRAGLSGEAVTFFTEEDTPLLRSVAHLVHDAGGDVPEWMLHMRKDRNAKEKRHRLPKSVAAGETISSVPKVDRERRKRKQEMIEGSKRRIKKARDAAAAAAEAPTPARAMSADAAGGKRGALSAGKAALPHAAAYAQKELRMPKASLAHKLKAMLSAQKASGTPKTPSLKKATASLAKQAAASPAAAAAAASRSRSSPSAKKAAASGADAPSGRPKRLRGGGT